MRRLRAASQHATTRPCGGCFVVSRRPRPAVRENSSVQSLYSIGRVGHSAARRSLQAALKFSLHVAVAASVLAFAAPASAQNDWVNPDVNALREEVSRLRAELGSLTGGALGGSGVFQPTGDLSSDVVLRLGQFENQLRVLTGRLEQLEFQVRQLSAGGSSELDGLRYRLEAIEGRLEIAPPAQAGLAPTADGVGRSYQLSQQPVDGSGRSSVAGAPISPNPTVGGGQVVGQPLGVQGQGGFSQGAQPPTIVGQGATSGSTQTATLDQGAVIQTQPISPGQAARQQQFGGQTAPQPVPAPSAGGAAAGSPFAGCEVDQNGNVRCPNNQVAGVQAPSQSPQISGPAAAGTLGVIPGQDAPGSSAQPPIFEQGGGADASFDTAVAQVRAGAFDDAERSLRSFVSQYPDDDRVGDAKYWIGETHYVRGQFAEAARVFLDAYREHPGAEKAPDSLLKLGMTFAQLNQRDEACLTFREVNARFPGAPENVRSRAEIESRRAGCE